MDTKKVKPKLFDRHYLPTKDWPVYSLGSHAVNTHTHFSYTWKHGKVEKETNKLTVTGFKLASKPIRPPVFGSSWLCVCVCLSACDDVSVCFVDKSRRPLVGNPPTHNSKVFCKWKKVTNRYESPLYLKTFGHDPLTHTHRLPIDPLLWGKFLSFLFSSLSCFGYAFTRSCRRLRLWVGAREIKFEMTGTGNCSINRSVSSSFLDTKNSAWRTNNEKLLDRKWNQKETRIELVTKEKPDRIQKTISRQTMAVVDEKPKLILKASWIESHMMTTMTMMMTHTHNGSRVWWCRRQFSQPNFDFVFRCLFTKEFAIFFRSQKNSQMKTKLIGKIACGSGDRSRWKAKQWHPTFIVAMGFLRRESLQPTKN